MKDKGLLHIASAFKSIESNNATPFEPVGDINTNHHNQDSRSINHEHPSQGMSLTTNKLLTFKHWKKEREKNLTNSESSKKPYAQDLLSFSKWKTQSDVKYEGIKKATQNAFPDVLKEKNNTSDDDIDLDEVLPAETVELLSEDFEKEDVQTSYSIDDLAFLVQGVTRNGALSGNEEATEPFQFKDNSPYGQIRQKIVYRRKKRGVLADIFIVILCLVGFYFSLRASYESLNISLEKINEEPIGTITFKYKSAQRKLSDRVMWDRVKQNTPIYNGDIIRTATLSEATVTFVDGNRINLAEQSLAQLFYNADGVAIDFTGGQITIDSSNASKGITLFSGNNKVVVEAGTELMAKAQTQIIDGKLTASENAPITIQIGEGRASLSNDSVEDVRFYEEGDFFVLSTEGGAVETIGVSVFSPQANAKFLRQKSDSIGVVFNWAYPPNSQSEYILELSQQKEFSQIVEQKNITDTQTVSLNLGDGLWHWRIYAKDSDVTETGKFHVVKSSLPRTIVPENGIQYTYETKLPPIRFMWSEDEYVSDWLFEVADNIHMNNPVIQQNTTLSSSIIDTLGEGKWFWRVTPTYSSGVIPESSLETARSEVGSFYVVQNKESMPIELGLPQDKDILNISKMQYFTWDYNSEAEFYTITICDNPSMRMPSVVENLVDNFYVLSANESSIKDGTWYWTVTKTNSLGKTSPQSEVRSFLALDGEFVHGTTLPINEAIIPEDEIMQTVFTWKSNIPYDTFLQVAYDENFENILIEELVKKYSLDGLSLPVGKWYWRILTKNKSYDVTYASLPKTLFVEYDLDSVKLSTPQDKSEVILVPSKPVMFSWENVDKAQYYEMSLYHEHIDSYPMYENGSIEETSILLDMSSMPKGNYICLLKSVVDNTPSSTVQKSEVAEYHFSTRDLVPIELAPQITLGGVDAVLNPPSIKWDSQEKVVSAEFILSSDEGGLSAADRRNGDFPNASKIVQRTVNPRRTIKLPSLDEGTWYWTIIGATDNGYDVTPAQPSKIVVSPIEKLPGVKPVTPALGTVFNLEYLAKNTYIDFSWEAVPAADTYYFSLYNERNEIILQKEFSKERSFHFEDLSILDRGTFSWEVEATRTLPNGKVQRGVIDTFDFAIELPAVIAPQNKTTGDLYGL